MIPIEELKPGRQLGAGSVIILLMIPIEELKPVNASTTPSSSAAFDDTY